MSNLYKYNPTGSTHGRFVQQMVSSIDLALTVSTKNMAMFTAMLDGDGTQDAHYATFKTLVGAESDALARALFAELSSAFSKISGDGSVSSVNAALKQLVARATA